MKGLSIYAIGVMLLVSLLFPAGALAAPAGWGETVHVVQRGETLYTIASEYGVTVEAILAANDLDDPDFVYVGQRLIIPTSGSRGRGCDHDYVVQLGDTLSGIAWQYDTTPAALMEANDMDSDFIYAGQRLCVPARGTSYEPRESESHTSYTVQPGDTLAAIALRFGVTESAIIRANDLDNASLIYVDQRLVIPGVSKSVAHKDEAPAPVYSSPDGSRGQPAQQGPTAPPGYQSYEQGMMAPEYRSPQTGPVPPSGYQGPEGAPAPPPGYQPPQEISMSGPDMGYRKEQEQEPILIPYEAQWVGSQTANNPDPDGITTLIVMTHEKEGVQVEIRSKQGFVAQGITGVYYEYSWIPTFAFRNIPGGLYEVRVEGEPSQVVNAKVDGGYRALVEFKSELVSTHVRPSPAGWIGEVVENTSGSEPIGAFSILVVKTGAIGNIVRVTAPGGFNAPCITGTKPEYGPGACDMGGLNAGTYKVILDGADIAVEVYLDGVGTAVIEFRPAPREQPHEERQPYEQQQQPYGPPPYEQQQTYGPPPYEQQQPNGPPPYEQQQSYGPQPVSGP
jgi:LysM repeat protein